MSEHAPISNTNTLPTADILPISIAETASPDPARVERMAGEAGKLSLRFLQAPINMVASKANSVRQTWTSNAIDAAYSRLPAVGHSVDALRSSATTALEERGTNPDINKTDVKATIMQERMIHRSFWRQRAHIQKERDERALIASMYGRPLVDETPRPEPPPRKLIGPRVGEGIPYQKGAATDVYGNHIQGMPRKRQPTVIGFQPKPLGKQAKPGSPRHVEQDATDARGNTRYRDQYETTANGKVIRDPLSGRIKTKRVPIKEIATDMGTPQYFERIAHTDLTPKGRKTAVKKGHVYNHLGYEIDERLEFLERASRAGEPGHEHVKAPEVSRKMRHPLKALRSFRSVVPIRKVVNDKVGLEARIANRQSHLQKLKKAESDRRSRP